MTPVNCMLYKIASFVKLQLEKHISKVSGNYSSDSEINLVNII